MSRHGEGSVNAIVISHRCAPLTCTESRIGGEPSIMELHFGERPAMLGTAFGVWLVAFIYLLSSANWRAVAVAVVIGIGILVFARWASRIA